MQNTHAVTEPWPESTIARYLTVGGATVDFTYADGWLVATCTGCGESDRTDPETRYSDSPEEKQQRIDKVLPAARVWAQAHAETCRAMPKTVA
ncbi:hypothetical protein OG978_32640 [Streptomyces sp. NBC_01591]|uniref:hypothetical protein n=1 Tax=Streptomyces sp. NBC_01591 TaxID=2975888 RepID=UPI002DDBC4A9|nr:hypothetical protein [Streptomyces sp. NBC_01591]WSD71722.1 hypothetical protein OG978_32640 [Streptomyces sp. NBC_01591]